MNIHNNNIYIIAGETSGDVLGAKLATALRHVSQGRVTLAGVGGSAMAGAGVPSLFDIRDLSVMGIAEVLPKLPKLINRINRTARDIIARAPRIVVTIDAPDFCFRVIKKVRKRLPDTKFIHYVAPSVWAWREKRAEKLAQQLDGLICLLPFEPPYFTRHGLNAVFCGHPAIELGQNMPTRHDEFFERYNLSVNHAQTRISLLFGSREGEVNRLAPAMFEAAHRLFHAWPNVVALVPAVPHLLPRIKQIIGNDQRFILVEPEDRWQAFALSHAALAASGTVGLELAMMNVPHAVSYKLSPLTYLIARKFVKVQHMHLVNILLGQRIVPEFLQDQVRGAALADTALGLLVNGDGAAERQKHAFAQARRMLGGEFGGTPAHQAATFVLSYL